jgi:hypothetical protein
MFGFNHALCGMTVFREIALLIFGIAKPVFGILPTYATF